MKAIPATQLTPKQAVDKIRRLTQQNNKLKKQLKQRDEFALKVLQKLKEVNLELKNLTKEAQ